jgi:N-methylhydantoinase B
MRIHYFRLRTDSGGAGRFRGGCGFEKEYECLCDDVVLSHRGERHYTQPWGLAGGLPGASSRTVVIRADGTEEVIPSKKTIHLMKGDRVVMWTSGGGGFGSPLDRPPEHVLEDVLDGKVGVEVAKDLYGVILKEGKLRHGETERMRARMRNAAMMDL